MNEEVVRMWKETHMTVLQDRSPAKTHEKSVMTSQEPDMGHFHVISPDAQRRHQDGQWKRKVG